MLEYRSLLGKDGCVEESELLRSCYGGSAVFAQSEFNFMEEWLQSEQSRPLLLVGTEGKKTLLCGFLGLVQEKYGHYLQLAEFASITPMYSNILYKIMIALRTNFDIAQKVELNEEKLRRYFKYWLEITSNLIEKQYLGYRSQEKRKVLIVIEGIDLLTDSRGTHVLPSFWLPDQLPPHIKLILSTTRPQPQLLPRVATLQYILGNERLVKILRGLAPSLHSLTDSMSVFELKTIDELLHVSSDFAFRGARFEDILSEYIWHVATEKLSADTIKATLLLLVLTQKGLSTRVLKKVIGLDGERLALFTSKFSPLLSTHQGYYIICPKRIKQAIVAIVDPQQEKSRTYHEVIARTIKRQVLSFRKLEQQIFHLLQCQNYNELKEVICQIENFIVLYTPLTKNLLCSCWAKLEQLEQYDPVFEYNRAVETFTGHYYPKEEDLFRIIFQLCMFFKEYSQFQNSKTPSFRHPPIRGEAELLSEISIYEQLKIMGMLGKEKPSKPIPHKAEDKAGINQTTDQLELKSEPGEGLLVDELVEIVVAAVTPPIESLNVVILSNQAKFRQHYLSSMSDYLNDYFVPARRNTGREKGNLMEDDESDPEEEKQRLEGFDKMKNALILKDYGVYLEEGYHKSGQEQSYYYYKQWLWLQFPWLCQSIKHDYSQIIKDCITSSTQYMSVKKEFHLIRQVLKLTQIAKDSKANIYEHRQIQLLSIRQGHTNRANQSQINSKRKHSGGKPSTFLKYKLDINSIDSQILKEEQYANSFKSKHMSQLRLKRSQMPKKDQDCLSLTPSTVFVTDCQQNRLPQLCQSKLSNATLGSKRLSALLQPDSTQRLRLVQRCNQLKNENDMMILKIEEFKKTMMMIDSKDDQHEAASLSQLIEEQQAKKESLEKAFQSQQELKGKLDTIIKICEINKMHGSESDCLGEFLSSLKFMAQVEGESVRAIKDAAIKYVDNRKTIIRDLKARRRDLQKDFRHKERQNNEYSKELERITERSGKAPVAKQSEQSHEPPKLKPLTRKKLPVFTEHENLEALLEYEQKAGNEVKLDQFAFKMDKRRELLLKNEELTGAIVAKKQQLEGLRRDIENAVYRCGHERDMEIRNRLLERKEHLRAMRERNSLIRHHIGTHEVK